MNGTNNILFCSVMAKKHSLVVFSEAMYFHSLLALTLGAFAAWLEGDRLPEELQLICLWALSRIGLFCKSNSAATESKASPRGHPRCLAKTGRSCLRLPAKGWCGRVEGELHPLPVMCKKNFEANDATMQHDKLHLCWAYSK